ncbi:MAG TPA: hypothetical protein VJN96_12875 [Vicinamibacterales bacterium]|nr:hypothetical protein [Vicinamibacterales bacterium]
MTNRLPSSVILVWADGACTLELPATESIVTKLLSNAGFSDIAPLSRAFRKMTERQRHRVLELVAELRILKHEALQDISKIEPVLGSPQSSLNPRRLAEAGCSPITDEEDGGKDMRLPTGPPPGETPHPTCQFIKRDGTQCDTFVNKGIKRCIPHRGMANLGEAAR